MSSGQVGESNVYVMEWFLIAKLNILIAERQRLHDQAVKISKRPDPNADPFAAPLMAKASEITPQIDKILAQIRFIRDTEATREHVQKQDPTRPVPISLNAANYGNVKITLNSSTPTVNV